MKVPSPTTQTAAGALPTRRFAATRISKAVEADLLVPGGEGIVEGVHRSAINIHWRGRLLTIAHESMGGLPNGILVDSTTPLDRVDVAAGTPVLGDGYALRMPEASLEVRFSGATRWSPAMPALARLTLAMRVSRGRRAIRLAADQAPRIGLGPLLFGMADGRPDVGSLGRAAALCLAGVTEGLRQRNPQRALGAAYPLIGLGPGATPSGDDLLVGLSAGLAATRHPLARSFAAGVARDAEGMTTSIAAAYLAHAGQLEFSERLQRAALAVLTAREPDLRMAIIDALAWGASSGADTMVGLLVGIQADAPWLRPRLLACADDGTVAA